MPNVAKLSHRDFMRRLYREHRGDKDAVCRAYARGEDNGVVVRKSNAHDLSAEQYALALYNDGERKGWLTD